MAYEKEIKAIIKAQLDKYFAAKRVRVNSVEERMETGWGMQPVRNYVADVSFTDTLGNKFRKVVFVGYAPMIDTLIDFDWKD